MNITLAVKASSPINESVPLRYKVSLPPYLQYHPETSTEHLARLKIRKVRNSLSIKFSQCVDAITNVNLKFAGLG